MNNNKETDLIIRFVVIVLLMCSLAVGCFYFGYNLAHDRIEYETKRADYYEESCTLYSTITPKNKETVSYNFTYNFT